MQMLVCILYARDITVHFSTASVSVILHLCVCVLLRTVSTAAIYQKTHLSNADIMSTADIGS